MSNNPSVPRPLGSKRLKIEKYMKYVPGTDKIEWNIPMSELMNPEKNKSLGEPE